LVPVTVATKVTVCVFWAGLIKDEIEVVVASVPKVTVSLPPTPPFESKLVAPILNP
jgi:hypothetical protein